MEAMKYTILVILMTISQTTFGCSCSIGNVPEKFKNSSSIFVGTVTSVERLGVANSFGDEKIIVEFDIDKTWKGNPNSSTLHTAFNGAGCFGYWFKKENKYLIYAFEEKGKLNTWWCGGVISNEESENSYKKEIAELNEITK